MFDEEPDGDPHGECAHEIHRLEARISELEKANDDLASAAIVPDGMKLIKWSKDDQEKGATEYIMLRVHDYAMASLQMHIKQRDTVDCTDERKHQQAIWCAIRDMVNNEISMLQDACSGQAEKAEYWQKQATKNSSPMVNQITGLPL